MPRAIERFARAYRDLRVLTASEVRGRAADALARLTGSHLRAYPPGELDDRAIATAIALGQPVTQVRWRRHLVERTRPVMPWAPAGRAERQPLLRPLPADPRADSLLSGAVLLYGRPLAVAGPVDWHRDPLTGHRWAVAHWSKVPVAAPEGADVRNVWEVSRHRELFVLGREYWRSGDERFAAAAAARLDSWMDQNPPEVGINWWSNLEIAVRSIAWIAAIQWFAASPSFPDALLWRLTGGLVAAGRHLIRHLPHSVATMPGNHVIGDAAGLATIALALPELAEAEAWRARALSVLEREAAAQVDVSGTHVENAPAYHAFVWELLYLCEWLAGHNGIQTPAVTAALDSMMEPLLAVARPDRTLPPLGDSDEGVAFDLDLPERRLEALAALAAVRSGDRGARAFAAAPGEALAWFGGGPAVERWRAIEPAPLPTRSTSGFGVCARSSWAPDADYLLVRGGSQSRHTHADALHVDLVARGRPVFEDAGTFGYTASRGLRQWFRGTRAHNSVTIDGQDQAIQHRAMRWASPLATRWHDVSAANGFVLVDGEHDGYARLGVRHRRQVCFVEGVGCAIADLVSGSGTHAIQLQWHAAPAGTAPLMDVRQLPDASPLAVERQRSDYSPRYAELSQRDATTWTATGSLPRALVTWIAWSGDRSGFSLGLSGTAEACTARVAAAGRQFELEFGAGGPKAREMRPGHQ